MGSVETDLSEELALQLNVQLKRTLVSRFIDAVADVNSANQVVVRDLQPGIDLASGGDNGWNGTDNVWTQDFSGGNANAWNEAYSIDSGAGAEDKVLGFVALQMQSADPATHGVRFVRGTGGSEGFSFEAHVQEVHGDEEAEGYFADAQVFGLTADGAIEHYIDATDTDTVVYLGAVAEEVGENVAVAQNPGVGGLGRFIPRPGQGGGNGGNG